MNSVVQACVCIVAGDLPTAGSAVAACRAGAVGTLDLEFCRDLGRASDNLSTLKMAGGGTVGLRLGRREPAHVAELLTNLADWPHWLILSANGDSGLAERIAALPSSASRKLLVEVADSVALSELDGHPVDAVVAKGYESGGVVGEYTTFVLFQKLVSQQRLPVFVHGGLGIHGAAGCLAAGAAGVMLDDQLLLMQDSSLPAPYRTHLTGLSGQEAQAFGERLGKTVRVFTRPGFEVTGRLRSLEAQCEQGEDGGAGWSDALALLVGWGPPGEMAWPVGQGIGLAERYRDRYRTTGRFLLALEQAAAGHLEGSRRVHPLGPGAPLAASHGTRFPIVQGPMTRVSDVPAFADAVSQAGALPFVALALMRASQTRQVLQATRDLLGDRPWGVGLLGFLPSELRDEQIREIWEVKPPFALIAGGRPDQAAQFEERGIQAYIHVPSPVLLQQFVAQGARRFVFEGRECGGHVGPLSSLCLWESMIDVLLERAPRGSESDIHVLFAGGIHDARSAAIVSVMAAPLVERGVRVGVLMGTAYLFTHEIVATGAVVSSYQTEAVRCESTVTLETGPGHASRCAMTPFAEHFFAERRRLMNSGKEAGEILERLEELNLGRLRLATKGRARRNGGDLVDVDADTHIEEGMFMLGQVATLRNQTLSMVELHQEVSQQSAELILHHTDAQPRIEPAPEPVDIAIIGIGTLLPKAQYPNEYWRNILGKVNAITEIPPHRWDWRLYYDKDRRARDKIYSKWGGFLDDIAFDPIRYGIPPNSLRSIDPVQLLALEVVRRSLEDAGYVGGDFDNENTSVILGASGGAGDLGLQYGVRSELPRFVDSSLDVPMQRLPEWTEESFPGLLLNVVAGRVANRFDLGGLNCTIDAACASSLAAVHLAVAELESGRSKMAIAGGVDTVQSPFGYLCFSKTHALSPTGMARTFDKDSDGIVISEGLGAIVLKPLADAHRDGDRIYAVIKAVGSSSDGKALGLTAPRPTGQMRALARAYGKAGFSPATVGLFEAHGTGTVVGDQAELETIVRTLRRDQTPPKSCAVGSVKTQIGHTKGTAGVAGLVKAALSLHHRVLPPHTGVDSPLDPIADPTSPVYLLKEPRPWLRRGLTPRRAGVSAFGFGGTNFHVVLEEYDDEYRAGARALGADDWPCELFVVRADDQDELARQIQSLRDALLDGARPRLSDLAFSCARAAIDRTGVVRLAVVARSLEQLTESLGTALEAVKNRRTADLPVNVHLAIDVAARPSKIAFLFPGQGAQYVDMGREAALYLAELRDAIEQADRRLGKHYPRPISEYVYPPAAYSDEAGAEQARALTDTHVAQPAIGITSTGYLDLLRRLGVESDMVAGHSYGEYVALHAGGVLNRDDLLSLSETRGRVMGSARPGVDAGAMAAVQAERGVVAECLAGHPDVVIANHNAPKQCVISGPSTAVNAAVDALGARSLTVRMLPVAAAFHSSLMAPAQPPLEEAIGRAAISEGRVPVYANATGEPYPAGCATIREQLSTHVLSTVEFVAQIDAMYRDGARIFVEVGPRSILTGLTGQILEGREHLAVALDGTGGGLQGLFTALAKMYVNGVEMDAAALFENRDLDLLDLQKLVQRTKPAPPSATSWWLNGGCVRPLGESSHRTGELPALDFESRSRLEREAIANAPPTATSTSAAPPSGPGPELAPPGTAGDPIAAPATRVVASGGVGMPDAASGELVVRGLDMYQQTMRQFLALQERVMDRFLGDVPAGQPAPQVAGLVSAASAPPMATSVPAPELTQPEPPEPRDDVSPVASGRDAIHDLVLTLVSERTGYPAQMLGLNQDMEAELGIDSIKRVEILGSLQDALPGPLAASLATQMETFTKAKTLGALIDRLADVDQGIPAPASGTAVASRANDAIGRDELRNLVLSLVGDRTGYPVQMLGLDQDMEAELGIDSIKRVEILGSLQDALPGRLAEILATRMETLTKTKTLGALIDHLSIAEQGGPAVVASDPEIAPQATVAIDRDGLRDLVLGLVGDRTGYPVEMLGLDQDMEADLGIDSIKRVEILGSLQDALPGSLAAALAGQMESLTRVKTLGGLIDRLCSPPTQDAVAPAEHTSVMPVEPSVESAPAEPTEIIPRYAMRSRPAALVPGLVSEIGFYIITDDALGIAAAVAEELRRRGGEATVLGAEMLAAPDILAERLAATRPDGTALAGIIHLAALTTPTWPDSLADWRRAGQRDTKSLFALLKACADELANATGRRLVSASLFGGRFGRDESGGLALPTAGGSVGLLKSVAFEWPGTLVKHVDFDPELPGADVARLLVDELLAEPDAYEVGYPGGRREIFYTDVAPIAHGDTGAAIEPQADWVFLVTGGARGITMEAVETLAPSAATFILVGRTPLPGEERADTAALVERAALRAALIERAGAQLQSPARIEAQVERILREREIRSNVDRLRALGATVEYLAVDVADEGQCRAMLDDVYTRHGRIDGVIHGAGIIEDKLVVDKTDESFARVFDTKVDSSFILSQALRPEHLKLVVFFSSVAGRYGNRGQADYCAANEVMNRLACRLDRQWPDVRVVAINWGPWDSTGMASDEVKRQFRARGVVPIPVAAGRRFFAQEIRQGSAAGAEVIAGAGPWKDGALGPASSRVNVTAPGFHEMVFVTSKPELERTGAVVLHHTFNVADDPYLDDHRIDGVPVLPAAAAIEWMAETVQAAWPDWVVVELRDVQVMRGAVLHDDESATVQVRARASTHADAESVNVSAEIIDPTDGHALYRATVQLAKALPDSPPAATAAIDAGNTVDIREAYRDYMFHGPAFQLIEHIDTLSPGGVNASVIASDPTDWIAAKRAAAGRVGQWLFDPGLLDAALQLTLLWGRTHRDVSALPSTFGAVRRFQTRAVGRLGLRYRIRQETIQNANFIVFDAEFVTEQGQVVLSMERIACTCSSALNRLADQTDEFGRTVSDEDQSYAQETGT